MRGGFWGDVALTFGHRNLGLSFTPSGDTYLHTVRGLYKRLEEIRARARATPVAISTPFVVPGPWPPVSSLSWLSPADELSPVILSSAGDNMREETYVARRSGIHVERPHD